MSTIEELEAKIKQLESELQILSDIEAIKQLKGKYFRCLGSELWDELAECFAESASTAYSSGRDCYQGRAAIMDFLKSTLDRPVLTMHQGHQPEIQITSETTAMGTWSLEDCIITLNNKRLRCAAFYHDEYAKVGGHWKIKSIGYNLVHR